MFKLFLLDAGEIIFQLQNQSAHQLLCILSSTGLCSESRGNESPVFPQETESISTWLEDRQDVVLRKRGRLKITEYKGRELQDTHCQNTCSSSWERREDRGLYMWLSLMMFQGLKVIHYWSFWFFLEGKRQK